MLRTIWQCLNGGQDDDVSLHAETNWSDKAENPLIDTTPEAVLAQKIVEAMQDAEKTDDELRVKVADVVHIEGWTESLAKAVLAHLDEGIKVRTYVVL
ncbi:hypothetical protein A1O7_08617 [Cladophialophora yegresii CBS 114405]|uniref:Uncharacterized protein n=1 Tax=Cladophialophora yegresii CBS 114405 TaxID=1182544 RepID=W9VJK0_9EURO|nr:uncharacterized protein A1O7_08617 [Cladophialophora yegresii CBS 114405]EXJ55688.1 hypothetical protein A1O7_08617 [Cladophialophora yegresii CBS 114405]